MYACYPSHLACRAAVSIISPVCPLRRVSQQTRWSSTFVSPHLQIQPIPSKGFGLISTSALPAGTTVLQVPPLASLRLDPTDSSSTNAQAILASAIVHSLKDHTPLLHFCTGDPATDACRPPPSFALPQPTSSSPITLSRQQIAGLVQHNAFRPFDHIAYTHGSAERARWPTIGLWPLVSLINHSCIANCFWFVHPKLHYLVVRTSRPVALGSELTLAYRNPCDSGRVRQAALESQHGFTCSCPVCLADAQVDVKVRDTRECEMAVWNEAANRGFSGAPVARRDLDAMRAWVEAQRIRGYRPHDVRHVEYLVASLDWMGGADGAAARIREATRRLDAAEEGREVERGSAPDPVMDMIKLVRTGAMLLTNGQSEAVGQELMSSAADMHDMLFGSEGGSGWSFGDLVNGRDD